MKKFYLLLGLFLTATLGLQAQYPLVTIQDIQTRSNTDLQACIDSSDYLNDTVRVRARVMTHPDSARFTVTGSSPRAQFWIQSGTGPFAGLDVIQFDDPQTNGVANLLPGDSIEITGYVDEFNNETELIAIGSVNVQILASTGGIHAAQVVSVADLNDPQRVNLLPTGEQWEGSYIEVQNVTVRTVDPFVSGGSNRVSFVVEDASGNTVNISDKGLVQSLSNGTPPGNFVAPNVSDSYNYIRGVLTHSPNGCTGSNGRGYEMHPFQASDYSVNNAAPSVFNVMRDKVTPTSSQTVTVCCEVTAQNGVNTVTLNYAVGQSTSTYTQVAMTNTSGNTWCADIPAQSDGSFVHYYCTAQDSAGGSSSNPNVTGGDDPKFFTVRDNGTTIYDVQYVPSSFNSGNSGYVDMEVTVTGVVTGSAEPGNLGYVFIQEENRIDWAGIQLTNNASLATLVIGDKVTVTGTVKENFGFTRIEDVTNIVPAGNGTINAVDLTPETFTSYDFATNERYESMVIRLTNPAGDIFTVNANPDGPNANFAEYRIGSDAFNPAEGCRVIAGRQTGSANSSLNVSYVNDSSWATQSGTMNVPACIATEGDAFEAVSGIMQYTFGSFKLSPRNNCDFETDIACIVANTPANCVVGIEEAFLNNAIISAFPNPASGELNVRYELDGLRDLNADLYDVMGRKVAEGNLAGNYGVEKINVSSLNAGTYILSVSTKGGLKVYNARIVVIK